MDPDKANELQCGPCDVRLQALRNCSGNGTPAKIVLNNNFYTRCPRAISLESFDARYLVNVYIECRENHSYPAPGNMGDQTAFTLELFNFLDELVHQKRMRDYKEHKAAMKSNKKSK